MKAIDRAWEMNLQLPIQEQLKCKADLGGMYCPHNDKFNLRVQGTNVRGNSCEYYNGDCYDCWNDEIIE